MPTKPRLPILVLTGFLGSGKTTLLNRLLRDGPRTAVLINEFGKTPVDHQLLERQDLPLMTLSGGCLCCQIKGALAPFLRNLWMGWSKPDAPQFDRIILETSGVSSPEPVLDTLLRDRWLAERYALQGMVATLAIPAAAAHIDRFPEAKAQTVWADTLVLTQADLAATGDLAALETRLDTLAPTTPRLYAVRGELDPADLLSRLDTGYRRVPDGGGLPDHGFQSFSIHWEAPVSWDSLRPALAELLARHPTLVRVKGILHRPDGLNPIAIHGAVGRLYPPAELTASHDARGRLVFIVAGPPDGLATEAMTALSAGLVRGAVRLH